MQSMVERIGDLTGDFCCLKGFRARVEELSQTREGVEALVAVMTKLKGLLASGYDIPPGHGYGKRGWWVNTRLMKAAENLGLFVKHERRAR